ncbi:n/a [Ectocarpus siliculosus]|uniref:N/a n=1 Tax=Ectocarpus siliculosus TaxID=2880 RepID=D8LBP1_ECTSI|nr:n/a [Ectocarpus siliculosus]|eukprot:CBN76750.1 n/a [Ectocarpus siliculosus]
MPAAAKNSGDREVPRFLRPVLVLLTLSLLAIGGAALLQEARRRRAAAGEGWAVGGGGGGVVLFGPAAYAAGGVQLPESVVDDIFERADKDKNGVIGDEEIQYLVERAGGSLLDDASEIEAGVASVIKNLDRNADQALSRSDLNTYWDRLGTLLTVDEAAQWVLHAAQLPQEVADAFVNNMVTGYDFPELAARQGALLEQDLDITRPAFKRNLVRSMQWKLWGMGEEPAAPAGLRATSSACGAASLEWDQTCPANSELSFPVHKHVLRRALLGAEGERDGGWVTVMAGPGGAFFDAGLQPGAAYRYALQAWNALGHSGSVEVDVVASSEDCVPGRTSWFWSPGGGGGGAGGADSAEASLGGLVVATAVSVAVAFCLRALSGGGGGGGGIQRGASGDVVGSRSGSGSFSGSSSGGSGSRRESEKMRQQPEAAITGTARSSAVAAAAVSDRDGVKGRGGASSPTSVHSNGSGWGDRERAEPRTKMLGSGSTRPASSRRTKERLRRASSDVSPPRGGATAGKPGGGGGGGGGGLGRAGVSSAAIGDSVRRERAKRMMMYGHSSSRDDKDVCKECGKEWKCPFRRAPKARVAMKFPTKTWVAPKG